MKTALKYYSIIGNGKKRTLSLGWSENNFFFEIEKSVVLKTCQTGKIYEKNWFWRVATFGGLATPQSVF